MKGVLLVNLGSPDSPEPEDVKPYLDQFLMDKYVLDFPWLFRAFLVRGIILRKRPEESSHAYKKIWWPEGSPLIVISERVHKKVQEQVKMPVALAMRYGKPSIETGLRELANKGVDDVLLFPLYPQTFCAIWFYRFCVHGAQGYRGKRIPAGHSQNLQALF